MLIYNDLEMVDLRILMIKNNYPYRDAPQTNLPVVDI